MLLLEWIGAIFCQAKEAEKQSASELLHSVIHRAYLRSARSIRSTLLLSFFIQYFQNTYLGSIGSIRSTLLLMLLHSVTLGSTYSSWVQRIIHGSQVVNIVAGAVLAVKSLSLQGLYFGTSLGISIPITQSGLIHGLDHGSLLPNVSYQSSIRTHSLMDCRDSVATCALSL